MKHDTVYEKAESGIHGGTNFLPLIPMHSTVMLC